MMKTGNGGSLSEEAHEFWRIKNEYDEIPPLWERLNNRAKHYGFDGFHIPFAEVIGPDYKQLPTNRWLARVHARGYLLSIGSNPFYDIGSIHPEFYEMVFKEYKARHCYGRRRLLA